MASPPQRFAVVLNPDARGASPQVIERIRSLVDHCDVHVSRDPDDVPELLRDLMARGYGTIFAGGGDGTVTRFLNLMRSIGVRPRLGILKLGTGNAMAEMVSTGDALEDLRRYLRRPDRSPLRLPLCEAEEHRFAFAGLGLDAMVLNDYHLLNRSLRFRPLRRVTSHLSGYLVATFGITTPRMLQRWLQRRRNHVRITNVGERAYAIGASGRDEGRARAFEPGEVLFEGPTNGVIFGTCPYYGYGFKALPWAQLDEERFHLRVSDLPIPRMIAESPRIWRGVVGHPHIHDFRVDAIRLEFREATPYQVAGEAMGYRRTLTVGMTPEPAELVRFC